ncbi:TonB-dependent receptor domain-containing protein [Pasteurella atlantica]|uniref:TonB-dependent receptor domain-containing protein n=1 Tax=Pasteurellaceae TaxID=712 RepID=UPI00275E1A2B|nr:TonB-dependent receptor [Pasteurella atlantica]MDP8098703.1 TonB-dependent receptor [Pasteurella atlantica]MDP8106815.1 TonB-dependent receptor [Pasteurella atlantica]MDP8116505.1 TonB-dependent receptor [Pasteurella atlantica]
MLQGSGSVQKSKRLAKLLCCSFFPFSIANVMAQDIHLNTIEVVDSLSNIQTKNIAETIKTAKILEKQQISDIRDLVKYETGITVVEKGRMGESGYAIRGVDENRVNITIDGLQQAENFSSQGFKELFEGYGNFNNTRNGVEIENIKEVSLVKGADSTKVGSGALGGSVIFQTKDARDFLVNKDFYYKFKTGYASANNQDMFSHTLAGRYNNFDALIIRTDRKGTNLENFDYNKFSDKVQGKSRQKADPYHIKKYNTLIKLGYNLNDFNRFTLMLDDGNKTSKGHDWSYTMNYSNDTRHTNDSSHRRNLAFAYENYDANLFWDSAKVTVSNQKIIQRAQTDIYCVGKDDCSRTANPLNIQLKEGKVVDKEGNSFNIKRVPQWKNAGSYREPNYVKDETETTLALVNAKGEEYDYPLEGRFNTRNNQSDHWYLYNKEHKGEDILLDCSKFDCNSKLRYYHINEEDAFVNERHYFDLDLNKPHSKVDDDNTVQQGWNKGDKIRVKTQFAVEDIKQAQAHYKRIKMMQQQYYSKNNSWENKPSPDYNLILPSRGYIGADWKDRRLNTYTKQVNVDFEKAVNIKATEHLFAYGGHLSKTDKSMVNYSGQRLVDVKWWALNSYFDKIDEDGTPLCSLNGWGEKGSPNCYRQNEVTSFLIPVQVTNGALYFKDNIRVNDWLSFDGSYRYDKVSYKPTYKQGKSPDIPLGMFFNAHYQLDLKKKPVWDRSKSWAENMVFQNKYKDYYESMMPKIEENKKANKEYMTAQKQSFKNHSYALGTTIDPTDYLRVQAKFSKGFRAPTPEEMYFTFAHPSFNIRPNLRLKPETAETKELAFTLYKDRSYITLSGFRTDYKDFLTLQNQGVYEAQITGIDKNIYQNINQQSAKVTGIDITTKLALGDFSPTLTGVSFGYKYTYQKGKISGTKHTFEAGEYGKNIVKTETGYYPMNAIQPSKHVVSLGYISSQESYGVDLYFTHSAAKKAKDTYHSYHKEGNSPFVEPRSRSYNIFDLIGFYKPLKGMTIQAGIYNLFNKDYMTWDSARSIRSFGTTNMICRKENRSDGCNNDNQGIERFHSPERNFKLNLQYEF